MTGQVTLMKQCILIAVKRGKGTYTYAQTRRFTLSQIYEECQKHYLFYPRRAKSVLTFGNEQPIV